MKYQLYNDKGETQKEVELDPAIFGVDINEGLVHQVAEVQLANRRTPVAHTKDRSDVRGGGRKPWRQKGTGRARHGSSRSPIWKGGGVTFGPTKNRNFSKKINKKMKTKALFMCLTDRVKDNYLVLLDKFEVKDNKTKEFVSLVKNLKKPLNLEKIKKSAKKTEDKKKDVKTEPKKTKKFDIKDYKISILVVVGKNTAKVSRVGRNIPGVKVLGAASLNIIDILTHKNILITEDSLEIIKKTYLK